MKDKENKTKLLENRTELMEECVKSVTEIMKKHSKKTGRTRNNMMSDIAALPIWITTRISELQYIERNMFFMMLSYKELTQDYYRQEMQFNETDKPIRSLTLH